MCKKIFLVLTICGAVMACTHKTPDTSRTVKTLDTPRAVIMDEGGDVDPASIQYKCVCDCVSRTRRMRGFKTRKSCAYWAGKPCDVYGDTGGNWSGTMQNCQSLTGGGGGASATSFISKSNRLCTASEGGGADVILKNTHRSKSIKVFYDYKHEGFSYSRQREIARGGSATVLFCLRGTFNITRAEFR